jgi:hypothetical protein
MAALGHLVRHVLGDGAEKQMLWIGACRIVAAMTNLSLAGMLSSRGGVNVPMSSAVSHAIEYRLEDRIPVLIGRTAPMPAAWAPKNLHLKTFSRRLPAKAMPPRFRC